MRQPGWSQSETVLLICTYWAIESKQITRKDAVSALSAVLRRYAASQGIAIDSIYRNENGISMRLAELRYIFTKGKTGFNQTSQLFRSMSAMVRENRKEFERIMDIAEKEFADFIQSSALGEIDLKRGLPPADSTEPSDTADDVLLSETVTSLLQKHFSYGFNPDSIRDLMRIRMFAEQNDILLPEDDEELLKEIQTAGTIINGKVFPKNDNLSAELQHLIHRIFNEGIVVIYYDALLTIHEEWMRAHHIHSEEMLKELLEKELSGCHFAKRFMSNGGKQTEKQAVTSEIKRVWGERLTRKVDDISLALPYIPLDNVWRVISGNPDFAWVKDGVYLLSEALTIMPEEEQSIIHFVEQACIHHGFTSINDIPLESIEERYDELPLSAIQSGVYHRFLCSVYTLTGKILSRGHDAVDSVMLMKQYLADKQNCTYSEAEEVFVDITGTCNRQKVFQILFDSMIRISADKYTSNDHVSFDIDGIDNVLASFIQGEFCALRDITTFALFPACGQEWNLFLLESFCYRFSRRFTLHLNQGNFTDKNVGIIAKKTCTKSYLEMAASALAESDIALIPDAVGMFLFERGFTGKRKNALLDDITAMAKSLRKEL